MKNKRNHRDKRIFLILDGPAEPVQRDRFVSIEFTDKNFHRLFFVEFPGVSLMAVHAGIYMILGVPNKRVYRHPFFTKYYWATWQKTIERYSESGYVGYSTLVRTILREAQRVELKLQDRKILERKSF